MNLYRHVENNLYDVQIKEEQLQEIQVQRGTWLLVARHPAYRRQDPYPGAIKEKENQDAGELSENGESQRTESRKVAILQFWDG